MATASDAFSSSNRAPQGKADDDFGDFFEKLDLHDEEFEDVVVEEEAPELLEEIRWLALARVHTTKNFSQSAFFKDMRTAWNTTQPVRFRPIGSHLFVVQASCLGDWDRIMSDGPWLFRNMAVLLEPYDGFTDADEVPMVHMPIWLQIHKLPDGYCREDLIGKLLRSAGQILETRITGNSRGDYVRVRVKHDITKPLTKFVSIVKGMNRKVYAVRYEKLAKFCNACGIIGHDHKECGTGIFAEKDLKFGNYLYADSPSRTRSDWEPNRGDRRFGSGAQIPPTTQENKVDNELKDTASSPIKISMIRDMEVEKSSRKRLNMEEDLLGTKAASVHTPQGELLLLTDGQEGDAEVSPSSSNSSKRSKMEGDKSNSGNFSAGSRSEHRQSQ
ncbi:hypothetical protein VPH35_102540 [Triticum aestivum]